MAAAGRDLRQRHQRADHVLPRPCSSSICPRRRRDRVDESLKILSGMMEARASRQAASIRASGGARRAARGARAAGPLRRRDARDAIFAGQPFAMRSPIGTTKTLEAATRGDAARVPRQMVPPRTRGRDHFGRHRPARVRAPGRQEFLELEGQGREPRRPRFRHARDQAADHRVAGRTRHPDRRVDGGAAAVDSSTPTW